jgi:hypothetical protein
MEGAAIVSVFSEKTSSFNRDVSLDNFFDEL